MTSALFRTGLGALVLLAGLAVHAADRPPPGDAAAGKAWSADNVCKECHNPDGNSTVAEYPRLGGQSAAYLYKQLQDFRDGRRPSAIMQALAQGLGDRELADVAAHFAAQPPLQRRAAEGSALGRRLFEQGDAARALPACAACHGSVGKAGLADAVPVPVIGGQHRYYLRGQLQDWKSGVRRNSPDGVMNAIAARLEEADIEALADYLSGP